MSSLLRTVSVFPLLFAVGCSSPQADAGHEGRGGGSSGSGNAAGAPGGASSAGTNAGGSAGTSGSATTGGSGNGAGAGGVSGGAGAGALGGGGGTGGTSGGAPGGASGSGGGGEPACVLTWPTAIGATQNVPETIAVSGVFDGAMKRYVGTGALGTSGQNEDQGPLFRLADGSRLENVVVGSPAADGIHCDGTCTLHNVWWEDVGEDAATLDGMSPSQTMTIECGGARHAADKVFQHNGPGTMIIRHFGAEDFGKFYRSCGNCLEMFERHVILDDITARSGSTIVGINENYDDTADFSNIVIYPAPRGTTVCQLFRGNDTGAEPSLVGEGPDPDHCRYSAGDIDER